MDYKYIGILEPTLADKFDISEHKNKPILVFNDRKQHVIAHHLADFGSIENIEKIYNSLNNIIKKPDYVFYNAKTKGLEYYKNIDKNICVAVRVNPGKVLKVKSWYPANPNKINNRKKKTEEMKEGLES